MTKEAQKRAYEFLEGKERMSKIELLVSHEEEIMTGINFKAPQLDDRAISQIKPTTEVTITEREYEKGERLPHLYINIRRNETGYSIDGKMCEANLQEKKELIGAAEIYLKVQREQVDKEENLLG